MSFAKGKKIFLEPHTTKYLSRIIEALDPVASYGANYTTYRIGKVEVHFDGGAIGPTIERDPELGELTIALAEPYLYDIEEED